MLMIHTGSEKPGLCRRRAHTAWNGEGVEKRIDRLTLLWVGTSGETPEPPLIPGIAVP